MSDIKKRFPADTTLEVNTFLNDKKINGELYALLQSLSNYAVLNKEATKFYTYVLKKSLPTQSEMCAILGIKSPKTLRAHLNYLIAANYIVEQDDRYELPEMESIYFLIPLSTIQYLNDNCKEHVFKTYIYLGQRFKWAQINHQSYEFTLEELGAHIGVNVKNNTRGYEVINHALELLANSGLIEYVSYYNGQSQKKKLLSFSYDYKRVDG